MPQLDILIILPQIFWLTIFFTLFYFVLTYHFLPLFLKTINSRRYFLEVNRSRENRLTEEVFEKRKLIINELNSNIGKIKSILFYYLLHSKFNFSKNPYHLQFSNLNSKILTALNKSVLYCNPSMLSKMRFYPNILNKTKKKSCIY